MKMIKAIHEAYKHAAIEFILSVTAVVLTVVVVFLVLYLIANI